MEGARSLAAGLRWQKRNAHQRKAEQQENMWSFNFQDLQHKKASAAVDGESSQKKEKKIIGSCVSLYLSKTVTSFYRFWVKTGILAALAAGWAS